MVAVGDTIGKRYKIIKKIGGGGFCRTFLAKDTQASNPTQLVVKQLQPEARDAFTLRVGKRLFNTEVKTLRKLGKHDRIPRLLDNFEEDQEVFLVEQFIEGKNLSQELKSGWRWNEAKAIAFLRDILETLAFVHGKKVIHRDIKPENLIRRKSDQKIALIDFGSVKQLLPYQTKNIPAQTIIVGTTGYMPSEQANGTPRLSSDIYAVGLIAIQALTGLDPAKGQLREDNKTGEITWQNRTDVSPELARILDKMVRYDFRQRYASAREALEAISGPIQPALLNRRLAFKVAGGVGLSLLAGGGLAYGLNRQATAGSAPEAASSPVPGSSPNRATRELPKTSSPSSQAVTSSEARNPLSSRRSVGQQTPLNAETNLRGNQQRATSPGALPLRSFEYTIVFVNTKGKTIRRQKRQAQAFTERLGSRMALEMISIPGGTFEMGSPRGEESRFQGEGPRHKVMVSPFAMGKFAVTQAQWQAVMNTNPSHFVGKDRPVERISWHDAKEFCTRLSDRTGRLYRLPTEAEWEYACRAGTTTPFHFGQTITSDLANYIGTSTYAQGKPGQYRETTTPVGNFGIANNFGLYDMHGNVWEWCTDSWHPNYRGAPTAGQSWQDDSRYRVVRGGSWLGSPISCRSACRNFYAPSSRYIYIGFRVVTAA